MKGLKRRLMQLEAGRRQRFSAPVAALAAEFDRRMARLAENVRQVRTLSPEERRHLDKTIADVRGEAS